MGARAWGWTSATPVALLLLWLGFASPRSAAEYPGQRSASTWATTGSPPRVVGAGRCSATACHGSPSPVYGSEVLRNEHTTWLSADPHTRAYEALLNETSRSISERLGRKTPAHRDSRCLACHSTEATDLAQGRSATIRADGVGCESCHGPAGGWLAEHTSADWERWSPEIRESRFGMNSTKDLARRAETCAGCHVGAPAHGRLPARDVDHDLIAAGHPRLAFEFSAFLALLPAHWREKGRNAAYDFPARAWAIGQVVTARSSVRQLRARAFEVSSRSARWPEFSEYDCTSCHRPLRASLPGGSVESPSGMVGTPAWGTWYYPMIALLAESPVNRLAGRSVVLLKHLRQTMEAPLPSPAEVVRDADETDRALAGWVASLEREAFEPPRVAALVRAVRAPSLSARWSPAPGWDEDSQRYLALVPLRQAAPLPLREDPRFLQELRGFRNRVSMNRIRTRPRDDTSHSSSMHDRSRESTD